MVAAKDLKARLDEIEKTMEKPPTWAELVKYAYSKDVDLTARYAYVFQCFLYLIKTLYIYIY